MFVVLLGAPGAGKGTQAAIMAEKTELTHMTTGELFRENIRKGSELGKKAKPYYDTGRLVPDELTIEMLLHALDESDGKRGWLLDGFPRNLGQAEALDRSLSERGDAVDKVLSIVVSDEEVVRRLSTRRNCRRCNTVYGETNQAPLREGTCDRCHDKLYQRPDDQPDIVKKRLAIFHNQTEPLIAYYRRAGKLREVDGENDAKMVGELMLAALKDN